VADRRRPIRLLSTTGSVGKTYCTWCIFFNIIIGSEPPAAHVILPRTLSSHRQGRRLWDHRTSPSLFLRGRRIEGLPRANAYHEHITSGSSYMYLQICLQLYESKNLHCQRVSVSVAPLPLFRFSPLILSRTKVAPSLTFKILQIRLTSTIGEEGQSYQHQSHVGFHRAVWSMEEFTVDLGDSVRTCQPGGVFP
jgi:hypothetical protein